MTVQVEAVSDGWRGRFQAMASPCEVLLRGGDLLLARRVAAAVEAEAARVEMKFSRYRDDNPVHAINSRAGSWVEVDDEIDRLLDYADECFRLSDGAFDITSGVLRRAWCFDGSDRIPPAGVVRDLLQHMGWHRVQRRTGAVRLQKEMELDFGGIGKEYAVDRALGLACDLTSLPVLINFGGDLACRTGKERPWQVGLEAASAGAVSGRIPLSNAALATSGDGRRYLIRDGIRYSHVLDPRTGWPVVGAPRSVTVAASHCTQAGLLATLALLQGPDAGHFLEAQQVRFWCQWDDDGASGSGGH